jgi:hypothetical protein
MVDRADAGNGRSAEEVSQENNRHWRSCSLKLRQRQIVLAKDESQDFVTNQISNQETTS